MQPLVVLSAPLGTTFEPTTSDSRKIFANWACFCVLSAWNFRTNLRRVAQIPLGPL